MVDQALGIGQWHLLRTVGLALGAVAARPAEVAPLGARETGGGWRSGPGAWRGSPLLVVQLCSGWVGAGQAGGALHLVKSLIGSDRIESGGQFRGLVGRQVKVFKTVQAVRGTECKGCCLCKQSGNLSRRKCFP